MASPLSLDERALILAPPQLATDTSRLLASAGIDCLCADDIDNLQAYLTEGAGMAIIAQHTLDNSPSAVLQGYIDQQPSWSDLPIVLLTQACPSVGTPPDHPLGNLTLLATPFDDAQLLQLIRVALRNRRRQYRARDQMLDLQHRLEARSEAQQAAELAVQQTRKMEAIGQLAGGVAHDFNNLLTSIGGSFELIERRLKQGRSQGLEGILHMGREAVSRAARLTHRLLAFSSRQSLHSQRIDLHALLQTQRLGAAHQHAVVLQLDLPANLWPVEADDAQLQEAVDNLLINACEAMPSGGVLRIEACNRQVLAQQFADAGLAEGEYACLSIIDNGQGMSQSTLEHAFDPFFSTKPIGQGVGLGLSMVYGFSKQSQGHVVLNSRMGQGTRVDLYLPRHLDKAPKPMPAPSPRPADHGRNVLLVEDDPHVRELLCQALHEDGFSCASVTNASEALQVLRAGQPVDLLVTDVGLPGMNGRQLAEISRNLRPLLPVLFITGYAETAMAREGFLAPGMQLICKPFELKHLKAQIAKMLDEV
ncbi:response regulator [Pseudomonas putida]|uniref:response regulator n=1 Tax=Pseudomonas putida TaxID=303 RepID=UPI000DB6A8B2|nr:response regulator [Pseudomonas putida]MBI6941404.1 response regulator [Pseudomonas putida]MBI6960517.1 response regulator [Pseudomonas putida]PZQ41533.1 MAG: hybrid sensor histidine kinase/response regulator [Pseudomonas putida]